MDLINKSADECETISFNEIVSLFDSDWWHVGVINDYQYGMISSMPIKALANYNGGYIALANHSNPADEIEQWIPPYTIVLANKSQSYDYTLYEKAEKILADSRFTEYERLYTNFKEAAIQAGIGVRARNSLVYNYRFGFDCHYVAFGFNYNIVDLPTDRRVNNKIWNRCIGCDDCYNACPAKAIRNKDPIPWIDSRACDRVISFGHPDYPHIPSMLDFYLDKFRPDIPKEMMSDVWSKKDWYETGIPERPLDMTDGEKYYYDGMVVREKATGDALNTPFCRECTAQPRCSKWGGKFAYEKVTGKIKDFEDLDEYLTHNEDKTIIKLRNEQGE